jgi:hypothetical protein
MRFAMNIASARLHFVRKRSRLNEESFASIA